VDEANDPWSEYPWKGNIDLAKLQALVDEHGSDSIAYLSLAPCVNMAGGQPFSMANIREVSAWAKKYGLAIIFDATRPVENPHFPPEREEARKPGPPTSPVARDAPPPPGGRRPSCSRPYSLNRPASTPWRRKRRCNVSRSTPASSAARVTLPLARRRSAWRYSRPARSRARSTASR